MENLAREFDLDIEKSKKAGLFHDIGKAIDIEQSGSHVDLGANFAKKNKMSQEVYDAIKSHHGDVESKTFIGALVAFADKISASRPGARKQTTEKLFQRIEKLEKIAKSFDEVKESYVIKGGKELRVIIKPKAPSNLDQLAKKLQQEISNSVKFPGSINIVLIKENRFSIQAEQNKDIN